MSTANDLTLDNKRLERARRYDRIHNWLFLVDLLLILVALSAMMYRGERGVSFALLRLIEHHLSTHRWIATAAYLGAVVTGYVVAFLPYHWFKGYYLEHQFQLSTQRWYQWLADELKSWLVMLAVVVPLGSLWYWFMRAAGAWWWLWAAAGWIFFQVILGMVFPVLILPLFYRSRPVEDTSLLAAVEDLARRCGVRVLGVYRLGLSAKTRKANAALAGLGATKRVLLGDTLLDHFTPQEVLCVLAHEFGHYWHAHLPKLLVVTGASAVVGMWLADRVMRALAALLGISDLTCVATFPLLLLALLVFAVLTLPCMNALARHCERRADLFALETTRDPDAFISAMTRLAASNLSNPEPHPLIEWLLHSHPSIARRIAAARAWQAARGSGAI
ncbi:MAG: M48 family metalloprotease [bacterium]|nr:M48 family metalloprotease [bacterium]